MKKLIDGKFFDTDNKSIWIHTADILPEEAIDPLGDDAVLYGTEALYRSGKGQFFLSGTISYS